MQFGFYLRTVEFFKTGRELDLECFHWNVEILFPVVALVGLSGNQNPPARMKAHVEIYIRLDLDGGKTLHDVLCRFSRDSKVWSFPQAESETYQKHIGGDGGYLILKPGKGIKPALVAIATAKAKQPNTFYVANIVPRDCFQLTIVEYNAIGLAFVRDFRKWLKKSAFDGSVHCTNANKTLADIIPGEKCRGYFERYLKCSIWDSSCLPTHPSDIE